MQTFRKKKLEIIIEQPYLHELTDWLDRQKISGYTVLPLLAGKGKDGSWSREGLVSEAGSSVMVFCILDESTAAKILAEIYPQLEYRIAIVTISSVDVIRNDHF